MLHRRGRAWGCACRLASSLGRDVIRVDLHLANALNVASRVRTLCYGKERRRAQHCLSSPMALLKGDDELNTAEQSNDIMGGLQQR